MRLFWVLASAWPFVAADSSGLFYNPPTGGKIHDYSENPVYTLGQTVQMRWTTTMASFSIMLWQNNNPEYEWVQTDLSDVTSYDWIVSTNRNLSNGNVFFFQVRNASNLSDQDEIFASHYFNITAGSSTTTALSSTSSSITQGTLQSTVEASGPSVHIGYSPTATNTHPVLSTRTASTEKNNGDIGEGLSLGAKVGLGTGAGVLSALILAGGLYFCFRKRNLKLGPLRPANNLQLRESELNANIIFSENSQGVTYGKERGNHTMVFEAPDNQKPNIFEASAGDFRQIFEAPLNEKIQIFELP